MNFFTRKTVWISLILIVLAFCTYALFIPMRPAPPVANDYCVVQSEAEIPEVAGLHFQLLRTSCDTLAKDISISLLVSSNGTDKGDVIFKYWPYSVNSVPEIVALPGNRILITITYVESIYYQAFQWDGISIDYDIGTVLHPRKLAVHENESRIGESTLRKTELLQSVGVGR